jgi:hypothetical protein
MVEALLPPNVDVEVIVACQLFVVVGKSRTKDGPFVESLVASKNC